MARRLRVEFPGAICHVMNREDRREEMFRDDRDRNRFLETMAEAGAKTGWQVHAYVLMPNHFHLVVEAPQPNLTAGMKWLLGTYTNRFNRRHKLVGHLFAGRYKSLIMDGSGRGYLESVCDYVHLHLDPPRAKLLADRIIGEELRRRRWTEAELRDRAKGDGGNAALAARLRAETTMTVGWIAERLGTGTRGRLNHLLHRQRRAAGSQS